MHLEYDEKGKLFTEVITKDKVRSHIQTATHHILGNVHVRIDERLSDELNHDSAFLAITEAEIYTPDGQLQFSTNFVAVNRKNIIWLMPVDQQPAD